MPVIVVIFCDYSGNCLLEMNWYQFIESFVRDRKQILQNCHKQRAVPLPTSCKQQCFHQIWWCSTTHLWTLVSCQLVLTFAHSYWWFREEKLCILLPVPWAIQQQRLRIWRKWKALRNGSFYILWKITVIYIYISQWVNNGYLQRYSNQSLKCQS